jgi:hypothetical protein
MRYKNEDRGTVLDHQIIARVTGEEKKAFSEMCLSKGVKQSDFLRDCIKNVKQDN